MGVSGWTALAALAPSGISIPSAKGQTVSGYGAFWGRNGVMLVSAPAATIGPSESFPAMKARGYGWVAGNVATGEWADERKLAAAHGLDFVPWMRVRNLTDRDTLCAAKKRWGAQAIIPNLEIEDTRQGEFMWKVVMSMSNAGKALVITDGWADPIGFWQGYRKWVGSVECFPEENPAFTDVAGCVYHASAFFRAVVPALGSYGTTWKGRLPVLADYNVPAGLPHIVYPGDSVTDWSNW